MCHPHKHLHAPLLPYVLARRPLRDEDVRWGDVWCVADGAGSGIQGYTHTVTATPSRVARTKLRSLQAAFPFRIMYLYACVVQSECKAYKVFGVFKMVPSQ